MYLTVFPTDLLFSSTDKIRPPSTTMNLPQRLREAIAQDHSAIEELPLSKTILEARIHKQTYSNLLSQLWYIHADLERLLTSARGLAFRFDKAMYRTSIISRDLAALEMEIAPLLPPTLETIRAIRSSVEESAWALLGCMYVLEGSRMGSMVLVKPLSTALNLELRPGNGLDYHLEGIEQRPHTWGHFKGQMLALDLSAEDEAHVLRGAQRTMQGLYAIYDSFSPVALTTLA
jgi:heme oxygenase